MLSPDSNFGHYKVKFAIGAGGMGEVFLAKDTKLDRLVAIKCLTEEFSNDFEKLSRFIQEAKSASALNHPNIITIYEIGEINETHFISTEYIEGETLKDKLAKETLETEFILETAIQITSALNAAHDAGIIHRDIKPENVMIRPDGLVKILDFGIAKLTEEKHGNGEVLVTGEDDETLISQTPKTLPGMIIGTANYMSPEQAKGKEVDTRTDIFSFGVVLYEMVSRHLPFEGETAMEMIGAIIHKEPKPFENVHSDLEEIISKTLRKNRNERYQSSKELLEDLQSLKKRVEFEVELERTSSPDKSNEAKTQIFKADTAEDKTAIHMASNINSIAVMSFKNLSADEDNEYFCDGLAEELINALAKVERLEVSARSSSFLFKGNSVSVSQISKKLNVRHILEGSVRKVGKNLRISVQLINATNGYQIWSERYDREMEDIFSVQDEIALAVVEALKVKLLGGEKEAVLKKYTSNAEAYQLYLKGRFFFAKRTPQGFDKAIDFYKQAIEIDSEYALAYSGVTDCYAMLGFYELMQSQEAKRLATPYLEKALEIDDSLSEIYVSKAVYGVFSWSFSTLGYYDKAISLNPKYALAHHYKASTLIFMSRFEEAIETGKKAVELEPFLAVFQGSLAWWNYYARRFDEAIILSLKTIEVDSNHFMAYFALGLAYSAKREFDKSISAFQKAGELNAPYIESEIGRVYGESGQKDKALEILNKLKKQSESEYVSPLNFAKIYAGLGETEKFFEYLEKACDEKSLRILFYMPDPALDNYRSDLRFQNILQKMNLPTDEIATDRDEKLEAKTVMLKEETADIIEQKEISSTDKTGISQNKPKSKRNWWLMGLLGILILTVGFFGYYYFSSDSNQIESIAVMPFVNESGDKDVEYLSDGMTETLIISLSNIPNLTVKARSSVFRFKGKEIPTKKIGEELNVKAVLLGRIVQRGEDLKLNLELVDVKTENVLWSEKFDRKMKDLVSLQSEIARDVSNKLRLKLTRSEQEKVYKTYTANSEAQKFYLKGRFHWNKRTAKDFEKAIEYFKQAIKNDPNYALAYTGLADSYALLPSYAPLRPKEYLPKAKQAALKALEIDDSLAEAHASLGQIKFYFDYDWEGAEREYKRAIEINPNYATAHFWYAEFLSAKGQHEKAIAEMTKAITLEPVSFIFNRHFSQILLNARNYDEAIVHAKKAIKLFPEDSFNYYRLGESYAGKGMYSEAFEQVLIADEKSKVPPEWVKKLKDAYEARGWEGYQQMKSKYNLERFLEASKTVFISPGSLAVFSAGIKDKEDTLLYLKKAFEERSQALLYLKVDSVYDFMREDPRFEELVKKVDFPENK